MIKHSALYEGTVRHRRRTPVQHELASKLFMVYLDLDELSDVLSLSSLLGEAWWQPARYQRKDFIAPHNLSIKNAVKHVILIKTGHQHEGPVRMLANLRYFGYVINPITCYYCFNQAEQLQFIVAEVTNTPWGERQSYVLDCRDGRKSHRVTFQKTMHVSPFNPMNVAYEWISNTPSERLSVHINNRLESGRNFDATLVLDRTVLSRRSIRENLMKYPFMTAKILLSIYWNALKLGIKGAKFYPHPKPRTE